MRAVCAVAVMITAACHAAAQSPAGQPAAPLGSLQVVVANQQSASASVLAEDGETMQHIPVGEGPHEAAVAPDGRTAVVTIYGAQTPGNGLAILDLVAGTVVRTLDLGSYTRPHGVVFLGGRSDRVAVTSEATGNVVIVDLGSGSITAVPTEARASHMVAVNAQGTRGWTANVTDDTVSELDLVGHRFVRSFRVPARPEGITVTPDGEEVWVGSNETGAVTVISTATGEVVHTLTGASFPYRLAASPDGSRIAIVDGRGDQLLIVDRASRRVAAAVPLDSPRGVAIADDNRTAFVTLGGGRVVQLDLHSGAVVRSLPVGASPDGVGVGFRR